MSSNSVILVDKDDRMLGTMDKMAAHRGGKLHRAFSVFIFDTQGRLLLQQRALDKYHSGGLWSNTCCSHPAPGEKTIDAVNRRLMQEMGIHCELDHAFSFIYREEMNGLTEHELDHVFFGVCDTVPVPAPIEVAGFRYMPMQILSNELKAQPAIYTKWLEICFDRVMSHHQQLFAV
jgi:isopentenyl-diphosphate delta-isomerase